MVGLFLGSEAGATFDAATSQDFAAVFGGIAFHEAVLNLALTPVRLISTFWHKNPLFS